MDKQTVLGNLEAARGELLAAVEGLDEARMASLTVAGDWTLRDVLAHIAGWAAWDVEAIQTLLDEGAPDFAAIQDVDTFNARLVARRQGWPVERILAELGQAHDALLRLLASMSEHAMCRGKRFVGPYWDNLAGWLRIAWEHEREHAAQIRAGRQEASHAH